MDIKTYEIFSEFDSQIVQAKNMASAIGKYGLISGNIDNELIAIIEVERGKKFITGESNCNIPLVSESFMSKLSDKKDMMYKEVKKTVDVDYFSFVGGWTTAIEAIKSLGEKIYSR